MQNENTMSSRSVGMRDMNAILSAPISRIGCCPQGRGDEGRSGFTARFVTPQCRYAGYSGRRGFTLIELLVVVLIIGILAAVALPQYQKAVIKSRYATLKNLANSIALAEELYYLTNGEYTDNFTRLDIQMPQGRDEANSTTSHYKYPWGSCRVNAKQQLICTNTPIRMQLQKFFSHTTNPQHGLTTCVVLGSVDVTDMRNQICKQETGKASGNIHSSENYTLWVY